MGFGVTVVVVILLFFKCDDILLFVMFSRFLRYLGGLTQLFSISL